MYSRGELVDKIIGENEIFLRCIMSPMFYDSKKERPVREAFLPRPESTDASMFRLRYTSLEECANIGETIKMKNNIFLGIASISHTKIIDQNKEFSSQKTIIQGNPIYAPMHNDDYIQDDCIYTHDPNVNKPGHIEFRYNHPFPREGEIKTLMRLYANKLAKQSKMEFVKI